MSRAVVVLNTRTPQTRFRVLKSKAQRRDLPANSTDIFQENIFTYYQNRPVDMEDVNLFSFARWYIFCEKPRRPNANVIKINNFEEYARKRKSPAVIRLPKLSKSSDEYYYSLLMLALLNRDESELISPFTDSKTAFSEKVASLANNQILQMSHLAGEIEDALQHIGMAAAELDNLQISSESYVPVSAMANISFPLPQSLDNLNLISAVNNTNTSTPSLPSDSMHIHSLSICTLSLETLNSNLQRMTPDQKNIYDRVMSNIQNPSEVRVLVQGPGGVGKFFLIHLLAESLRHRAASAPGEDSVKLAAPTGIAARNISWAQLCIHY